MQQRQDLYPVCLDCPNLNLHRPLRCLRTYYSLSCPVRCFSIVVHDNTVAFVYNTSYYYYRHRLLKWRGWILGIPDDVYHLIMECVRTESIKVVYLLRLVSLHSMLGGFHPPRMRQGIRYPEHNSMLFSVVNNYLASLARWVAGVCGVRVGIKAWSPCFVRRQSRYSCYSLSRVCHTLPHTQCILFMYNVCF